MEIWKDIKGYEGLYQVSNLGRVKSLGRFHKFPNGGIYEIKPRILKNATETSGYLFVALYNGYRKQYKIHRLVAEAFIPNPNNLPQVNHKDLNKQNNRVDNLEWCTASENIKHAFKHGVRKMPDKLKNMIKNFDGENNPNSKLKKDEIIDIKTQINNGISYKKIAQKYNLNPNYIYLIKNGKVWKNI